MNKINLNWKFCLMALLLIVVSACSGNDDLTQIADRQNLQEGTRTASWYTKEVTLEEIGTLKKKLAEVMAGENLNKLD